MNYELESFKGDINAGCDIQRNGKLYRQVEVVIGPGITKAELLIQKIKNSVTPTSELGILIREAGF